MKYRELGKTGIKVSEVGFGAWGLGGDSYGEVDDTQSKKALSHAFEMGVNFFDTSNSYGSGHSEKVIAQALSSVRQKMVLATKVGCLPHKGREMPQDFSPESIRAEVERSLKRLNTDYIDLYQLHSPLLKDIQNDQVIDAMLKLKQQGKVRVIGVSTRSPQDAKYVVENTPYESVQLNFNLSDQRALYSGVFDAAVAQGTAVIVRTPLCFGFLTGSYLNKGFRFSQDDHRSSWPEEQLKRWSEATLLFKECYEAKNMTPAQAAIKYCLSPKGVSTVIPGMMTVDHVMENIGAVDAMDYTAEELERIDEIGRSHTFFDPTLRRKSDVQVSVNK